MLQIMNSGEFIGDYEHREWAVAKVAARYQDAFSRLEDGIYIFGYSHIQEETF